MKSGWSIKHVQRLILGSATFQQSSAVRADAVKVDADGRLLWRYTPRRLEAEAIRDVLGSDADSVPVVAAKSNFGNLGAGSGLVECIASLLALRHGALFPLLNYQSPDPECAIRAAASGDVAGASFVSSSVTPQGQAGSVVIGGWNLGA